MQEWAPEIAKSSTAESMQAASLALSQESFDQSKLNIRDRQKFTAATAKVFGLADSNHDGELTRTELFNAVENNHSIKGVDAQALAALTVLADYKSSKGWDDGTKGIRLPALELYADVVQMPPQQNEMSKWADKVVSRTALAQQYTSEVFDQKFFPALSIKAEDVKQGFTGACEFLAPLASLADKRPGDITKMITDNHDGSYSVKFPYLSNPIKVSSPTEAERGLFAQGSVDGTWPAVLEKAYRKSVQLMTGKPWSEDTISKTSTWNGGFQMLTGIVPIARDIRFDNNGLNDKELDALLSDGVKRNAVMEAGRYAGKTYSGNRSEDIPSGHAYSILGYDSATKHVTLRNPWGKGEPESAKDKAKDGKNDGVFVMTLQEFRKNFDGLMME